MNHNTVNLLYVKWQEKTKKYDKWKVNKKQYGRYDAQVWKVGKAQYNPMSNTMKYVITRDYCIILQYFLQILNHKN